MKKNQQQGFTLIELMIAVGIVAILASVAYGSYRDTINDSRRADAQGSLTSFAISMERFFTETGTYQGAATGGGNTGAPTIFATEAPLDGATKYYDLSIQAANATTFTLRATPKNAQAGDGFIELTSTGTRRWDKNNNGSAADAGENCWQEQC